VLAMISLLHSFPNHFAFQIKSCGFIIALHARFQIFYL
jgi:hypothetical protein